MKKIVGIIAALSLVAGVAFADAPAYPAGSVAAFSGDASIEYQFNLDDEAFGIANAENANFKIQFYNGGDKATEGDGLWGELKISVGAGDKELKNSDKGKGTSGDNKEKFDGVFQMLTPSVDTAKIHFVDGDFYARMNIKAPGLSLGKGSIATSTWSAKEFTERKVTLTGAQGFTIETGLKDVVEFNIQFADNGVKKSDAKEFGFLFDAALKAVENLNLYAGVAYSTEKVEGKDQDAAIAVRGDYKLGLTDTMYIKPAVGFNMQGKAKELGAGVLFGWGTEGQEAKFAKFKASNKIDDKDEWDNVCDKVADGVSVFVKTTLEEKAPMEFLFSFYDGTLLAGLSDVLGGLKVGAQLYAPDMTKFGDLWIADAAFAYSHAFDAWKVSANFGLEVISGKAGDKSETKTGFLWGFGIENDKDIIDNTTLYLNYNGQKAKDIGSTKGHIGKDVKGTIKVGAKIHF